MTILHNNKKLLTAITLIPLIIGTATISNMGHAEQCYVWTEGNGVKHFGSIPPANVKAKSVPCNNKASENPGSTGFDVDTLEQQRIAKEQREAQCKNEKQRLSTLKTSGTSIRMQGPDGSVKYLSQAEIDAEIKTSQDFVSKNCK